MASFTARTPVTAIVGQDDLRIGSVDSSLERIGTPGAIGGGETIARFALSRSPPRLAPDYSQVIVGVIDSARG